MPEELCQVSPKSHYVSLALHSDPSPFNQFYIGDNHKDGDEINELVENRGHRPIMLNAILFYKLSSKFCSDRSGVILLVQ